MASISVLEPVSEEAELRKKEAKEHFNAIKKAGELVRVNSLRIGFHAAALKRQNLFGILGFESERDAQEASGVKQATWFNVVRIADAFPNTAEELFCAMKLTNAEALMDLPESKRLTEYWLRRAATDPTDLFKTMIHEEMNGKAKPSDGRERVVKFEVKMSSSQKKAVDVGLQEYAKAAGCEGNEAKAIELLVAEHKDGVSLVGTISHAIDRIAAIKALGSSGLSAAEALEKAYAGLDEMVGEFQTALESLQNLESGE
jgi:hypothetical protein